MLKLVFGLLIVGVTCGLAAGHALADEKPRITLGPYVEHLGVDSVAVCWQTDSAVEGEAFLTEARDRRRRSVKTPASTEHRAVFSHVQRERIYQYRVRAGHEKAAVQSKTHSFDAGLDYLPADAPTDPPTAASPFSADEQAVFARAAERIVAETRITSGYCVVLGCGRGRLAYELARRTRLKVIGIDDDQAAVADARKALDEAGVYGVRVTVQQGSLSKLPLANYLANLIVSERLLTDGKLPGSAAEMYRLLKPAGGIACLGSTKLTAADLEAWLKTGGVTTAKLTDRDGVWATVDRPPLPGAGDWTHQYGSPDNAACSQDDLVRGDARVLWFGQPGPRPMVDRGARNPAPLCAAGRLFIQGDRILFGLDAYNGAILWVLQIPELVRANIPRDASNMAAAADALHVVVGNKCWRLDPATGKRLATFVLPDNPPDDKHEYEWGYVARKGELLIGSAVKRGSGYVAGQGEWYDGPGWESDKVASSALFARDAATGQPRWEYRGGAIINPTITIADGHIYLVESRNPQALDRPTGRLGKEVLKETYLVALDAQTGRRVWESPTDFSQFQRVFYLAHAKNTLVAVGSSDRYHVAAFDATTGARKWQDDFKWVGEDHHGGAMQHPTIVGDTVYVEFRAFNLTDGAARTGLPRRGHGCGAQSASKHLFLYRGGYHMQCDIATMRQSQIAPARSGCWLGLIPAAGLILAPETSSGCSCTHAIQSSMAFLPQ
jgi:outer membrane protein assembly factor BamB